MGLVLSILPYVDSFILIIVFMLVKKVLKSMPNNFYKHCSNRNTAMAVELFPKTVHLLFLLLGRSCSLLRYLDIPSETIPPHIETLPPKCPCLISGCELLHIQYFFLDKHTEMSRPAYLSDVLPSHTEKYIVLTFNAPSINYHKK